MKKIKRNFTCKTCGSESIHYGLDNQCLKCLINDGFFGDKDLSRVAVDLSTLNDTVTLKVSSKFRSHINRFNQLARDGYIGGNVIIANVKKDESSSYCFSDLIIHDFSTIDIDVLKNIHGAFKGLNLVIYDIDKGGNPEFEKTTYHKIYDTEDIARNVGYGATFMFEKFQPKFSKLVKARSYSNYKYAINDSDLKEFKNKSPYEVGEWCYNNPSKNEAVKIDGKSVSITFNRGTTWHKSLYSIGNILESMHKQAESNHSEVWETNDFGSFYRNMLRKNRAKNIDSTVEFVSRRVGS